MTDAGLVQGVTIGKETLNEWLGQIKSATSPSLIADISAHQLNTVTRIAKGDLACLKDGEWVPEPTVLPFANECHEDHAVLDHSEHCPLLRQLGICGLAINSPFLFVPSFTTTVDVRLNLDYI